jgi:TPP-dependent pyruvate/acetoin dehydrogenase alpha subunit
VYQINSIFMEDEDLKIAAHYSLPNVNIYPNNKWGDIARNQGIKTANNWRAARGAGSVGLKTIKDYEK